MRGKGDIMNVIISNKRGYLLEELNLEVIKKMEGELEVDEVVESLKNFFYQRLIIDITALKNYKDIKTLQKLSIGLDMDKTILLLDETQESLTNDYLSKLVSMGIYNFTQKGDGIVYLYNNPHSYRDVAQYHQLDTEVAGPVNSSVVGPRIIGFENINKDAGSTTLIYMIKKHLEQQYGVVAIEVDKREFMYFRDEEMYGTNSADISNFIAKHSNNSIILVDINGSDAARNVCTEVYYLLHPSMIKLNKLMMNDSKALQRHKDHRIVLNQSLLSSKDVLDFEYEAKVKIFYNMPPLDEREKDISAIHGFLSKIGLNNNTNENKESKNKILGLFGK